MPGHDVRVLDSEIELEGLSDPEVLELAVAEGRVLVTASVILASAILRNEAFGGLISGVEKTLADTA